MNKFLPLVLAALIVFSCLPCCKSKTGGLADDPLAVVNGRAIEREGFITLLHDSRAGNTEPLPADPVTWLQLKVAFLDQVVERTLLEQEATRRHVEISDENVNAAVDQMRSDWPDGSFDDALAERQLTLEELSASIRHNLLTEELAKKVVLPGIEVTEEEVQSYYRRNPKEFSRPEQVRAYQILVSTEAVAAEILIRLQTGAGFIDLARAHSIAPEASQGGDLGYFGKNQMPKVVENACFALDVGQTSDIIKSQYGYHVFRIKDRRPATVIPLNSARVEIVRKLKDQKRDAAWQAFLARLKDSAQIKINETMLASISRDEI